MWKCPKCNFIMKDDDRFCNNCGEENPNKDYVDCYKKSFICRLCIAAAIIKITITFIIGLMSGEICEFLMIWGGGIITGIILFALAEIIRLLKNIQHIYK